MKHIKRSKVIWFNAAVMVAVAVVVFYPPAVEWVKANWTKLVEAYAMVNIALRFLTKKGIRLGGR